MAEYVTEAWIAVQAKELKVGDMVRWPQLRFRSRDQVTYYEGIILDIEVTEHDVIIDVARNRCVVLGIEDTSFERFTTSEHAK